LGIGFVLRFVVTLLLGLSLDPVIVSVY